MKKIFYTIGFILFLFSCDNTEEVSQFNEHSLSLQTENSEQILDSIATRNIIDPPKTELQVNNIQLRGANANNSLWDIRDMDLNIVVKENSSSKRYLQSQGVGRELIFANKNDNNNQKFRLSFMPLTYYILIRDNTNNLLSMGVYEDKPDVRVLYAKDNNNSFGACWNFNIGDVREESYILENADAIKQGSGGMWDIYYEVIGANDAKIYFDKYRTNGKQEFSIIPLDNFVIHSIEFFNDQSATLVQQPDFVARWTYTNRTSLEQGMSTSFTQRATKTSSFSNQTSLTLNYSQTATVKVPFFGEGSITLGTSLGETYTFGESETKEDSQTYNFPIRVPPYTTVNATATVKRYKLDIYYRAKLRGVNTGKEITIDGLWTGVDCSEVIGYAEEIPLGQNKVARSITFKIDPNKEIIFE
jgi:Clostridium epsilon toxin ETX/Bacillus mosquitocidal toxin MTX2.